ncbi:Protein CREG1 [Armadillidium vulgare]|nr:Protein CREG1 [Armadillidium vulgare]
MVDLNDKTVPNPNKNPEKLEEERKTDGTRVLVYDGKQKYVTWPDPPPKDDIASVARYVMHISEFGSLATNSTHKGIEGYPFVNVFSVSDGPFNKSTGTPYFYFTPLELSVIDMKANNKVSLTVTEAQSDYCSKKGFDPEDPRCSHAIFTGVMEKIEKDTEEEEFARNALFSRHVEMSSWPSNHDWFFGKIKIQHIYLLDFFGGAQVVDVEEYFAANPFESKKKD